MKMKFTNEQMGNYIELMSNLHETGKLGYAIARNLHKMSEEAKEYMDLRSELFQKYGTQSGQLFTINEKDNPEGFKAFKDEMGDIPFIEFEVNVYQVDEETFFSGSLTSDQMAGLLWMVKEE